MRALICFLFTLQVLTLDAADPSAPTWRVVTPSLQSDRPLVAAWTVKDFGAKGDGTTDDTAAFQRGLTATARIGGGTLYAPAGRYAIRGVLTIPTAVTLAGDWRRPETGKPVAGTILMVYAGRGQAEGKPFINVSQCAGVRGLTLWWPEQKANDIQPYPFALKQLSGDSATFEDITLVNAYRGVLIGPEWNELHLVQELYGTVLDLGIRFDHTTDIGRLEAITLAPWIWSSSGLPDAPPANGAHVRWMKEKGTGIHMLRSDWEYVAGVTISGYRTGFAISGSPRGHPNAQFWRLNIADCGIALDIHNANSFGLAFTSCTFVGSVAGIATSDEYSSTSLFHDCTVSGELAVDLKGTGAGQFQHCTFTGPIQVESGVLVVADSMLSAATSTPHITLGFAVMTSSIAGNRFNGNPRIVNHSDSPLVVIGHKQLSNTRALPKLPDARIPRPLPAKTTLRVVEGVSIDGKDDATTAIQAQLDAAGRDGGGIVFLPAGTYAVRGNLSVPMGVELRGVYEVPHHSLGKGSMLFAYAGKDAPNSAPLITLAAKSGVRGLTIHYPDQDYEPPKPYPPCIQGRGAGVWVIDTTGINPWNFIDLASYRCDNHVLDYVAGAPLKIGIAIGAGTRDGQVRNTQFNPHYFFRGSHPKGSLVKEGSFNFYWNYQKTNLDAFVLGACDRELLFQNFVYGSLYGIHLTDDNGRGPSGWCLGHGTDGSKIGARIDGLGLEGMDFINTQLVCIAATDKVYIVCGPSLKAETRFFSSLMWGSADFITRTEAGALHLQLANVLHHVNGMEVKKGSATVINTHFGKSVINQVAPLARLSFAACLFDRGLTKADTGLSVNEDRNATRTFPNGQLATAMKKLKADKQLNKPLAPDAPWDDVTASHRLGIVIEAGNAERLTLPIELDVALRDDLCSKPVRAFCSIERGLATEIPAQLDPIEASSRTRLTLVIPGLIPAKAQASVQVYLGLSKMPAALPQAVLTQNDPNGMKWLENDKVRLLLGSEGAHIYRWEVKALGGRDITQPGETGWAGFSDIGGQMRSAKNQLVCLAKGPALVRYLCTSPSGAKKQISLFAGTSWIEEMMGEIKGVYTHYDDVKNFSGTSSTPGKYLFSDGKSGAVGKETDGASAPKRFSATWSIKYNDQKLALGLITPEAKTLHAIGPGGIWGGAGTHGSPPAHVITFAGVLEDEPEVTMKRLQQTLNFNNQPSVTLFDLETRK